jgi:hypothetical protein
MIKTMGKYTGLFSVGIVTILITISFTSTVAFQSMDSIQQSTSSPLFYIRLKNTISREKKPSISPMYLGVNKTIEIPLPTRELLTDELLNSLSSEAVKAKISLLNEDLAEKWDVICDIARDNLAEINRIIRQNYTEYQKLIQQFFMLSEQEAKTQFLEKIQSLDIQSLFRSDTSFITNNPVGNITTGPICNITSGSFCQITTQPICQITTQPICLITKGFFCWTVFGPICKTTGIKCHPPTSRPTLCSIFAVAGKILKTLIILILLATVIFVPVAILGLVFITVFNAERCDQIRQQLTVWFNCTTPEL